MFSVECISWKQCPPRRLKCSGFSHFLTSSRCEIFFENFGRIAQPPRPQAEERRFIGVVKRRQTTSLFPGEGYFGRIAQPPRPQAEERRFIGVVKRRQTTSLFPGEGYFGRIAQLVRVLPSHGRGRRFKSFCAHDFTW